MRMSTQQQKYVSLTVSAVSDLMNDTLRALGRPDSDVERVEVMRALQLGLDEIELLWDEVQGRSENLAGSGASLAAFLELAPDAYLVTEGDGTIRLANRMAVELMETSTRELYAKPLEAYVREQDRCALAQELESLSGEEDNTWHIWWSTLHFKDGSDLDVEFRVRGFHPPDGPPLFCWLLRAASLSALASP
jgi:PAS domain-containing protein